MSRADTETGSLILGARPLSIADVVAAARGDVACSLDADAVAKVRRSRDFVDDWVRSGRTAYGVNTGFGSLARVRIGDGDIEKLQVNLLRSHSAGVGEPLPPEVVRAMMLLRAVALLGGHSGIRLEVVELLLKMLEKRIHPVIPCQGSVGASGDLAPLAHLALTLIGEGEVTAQGERQAAAPALRHAGLEPVRLLAKEGLALINGTQAMTAIGALALHDMARALRCADIVSCMSLESMLCTDASLHARLHEVRGQLGQIQCAANMRRLVAGSALIASHKDCSEVQDAYSIRCIPQVHGAARDIHRFAVDVFEREINAVTDNPLVFPEEGLILSGGNFHGAPVAMAMDSVALGLVYLCNISERRTYRLMDATRSGLPAFLIPQGGLNSGLMLAQYTAAALTSENKVLAHPSSADTIPTSAGQEDHVSMGMTSARKLARLVDHTFLVLGIEALAAAQALDFREAGFGPGTSAAYQSMRRHFEPVKEDRVISHDITEAARWLRGGDFLTDTEAAVGLLQ